MSDSFDPVVVILGNGRRVTGYQIDSIVVSHNKNTTEMGTRSLNLIRNQYCKKEKDWQPRKWKWNHRYL